MSNLPVPRQRRGKQIDLEVVPREGVREEEFTEAEVNFRSEEDKRVEVVLSHLRTQIGFVLKRQVATAIFLSSPASG